MFLFFLSNLGMGGGGSGAPYFVDPDAGSAIATADDTLLDEVDPDAGSVIAV